MNLQIASILDKLPADAQQNLLKYAEFLLKKYVSKEDQGLSLTKEAKALLDDRLAHHEANKDKGINIEEFKANLISRYGYDL